MAGPLVERLDALIFDVDGTLAETEEAHRLAFNAAFAEAGLGWNWPPDLYRNLLQVTGGKERIRSYMDGLDEPPEVSILRLHARKTKLYDARVTAGETPLRPGIEALIHETRRRGVRLAIATTTSRPNIDALLTAQLGPDAVGWFDAIACGDMVAAKKPAPDVYLLALGQLDVPAVHAVAIEDSANGVSSAIAAGVAVIAVPSFYSSGDDFSLASRVLADPAQISQTLGWA